jgi:hypothetical protein
MKLCYSLTWIQANSPGNDYRINSRIWLQDAGGTGAPLSRPELQSYAVYIQAEIRRVWSTANNPGLSSGQGATPLIYNASFDTITCDPPAVPTHVNDTGVVVGLWADRLLVNPNVNPVQNEILFNVGRLPVGGARSFMDMANQRGQLYYRNPQVVGPVVPLFVDTTDANTYSDLHHVASHEFGHALGLSDRYHYLGTGNYINEVADPSDPSSNLNFVGAHGELHVPMYLPCLFDPTIGDDNGTMPPPYNQEPHNQISANVPQPNYNSPGDSNSTGPYDLEYSTNFAWIHNLMSRPIAPNDPPPFSRGHRFDGSFPPLPADPLYMSRYNDDFTNPQEIIIITKVQLDVVLDRGPGVALPTTTGSEISMFFSRDEEEMAESLGFNAQILNQYLFILDGLKSNLGPDPLRPTGADDIFFDSPDGGTFIGVAYGDPAKGVIDIGANGDGGVIVSDLDFDNAEFANILGINDIMSYRMSQKNPTHKWTLITYALTRIRGCINPAIGAKGDPSSSSWEIAVTNRVLQLAGVPTIPNIDSQTILEYGGPRGPLFINAVNNMAIGNPINLSWRTSGLFGNAAGLRQYRQGGTLAVYFQMPGNPDDFHEVGIAIGDARRIWSGNTSKVQPGRLPQALSAVTTTVWTVANTKYTVVFTAAPANSGIPLNVPYTLINDFFPNRNIIITLVAPS